MNSRNVLFMSSILATTSVAMAQNKIVYPITERESNVTDTYFGTKVSDPYRWLENDTSKATMSWVEAQNKVTRSYLDNIPYRNALKERMMDLFNYEKVGTPFKKNGKYYFSKNDGLQNQSVLFEQESLTSQPKLLLDPNKLSSDGTVALTGYSFSKNGKYMAYTISRSGSDWTEIYVMDLKTRKLLDDHIVWAKFGGASWKGDGFYYSAYDAPQDGKAYSSKNEFHKVYYHKIGTKQSEDRLEYKNDKYPLRFYNVATDEDERYLFLVESEGHGNALYIKDAAQKDAQFIPITTNMDDEWMPITINDNKLFLYTNHDAPRYKVVSIDIKNIATAKKTDVIAEKEYVLSNIKRAGNRFILTYDKDASNHAYVYSFQGKELQEVKLPSIGSVGFSSDIHSDEVFYSFTSFTIPGATYSYNMDTNESKLFYAPKVKFNSDDYTTEQVTFKSKDGTPIKMFLTYKKGIKRDSSNPVFLYGYGGFNISLYPSFSPIRVPFMENGGIYAQVTLRGGGEYGEEWHKAGTKMQKQNVFDDFIGAAEYLIKEKYTSAQKMACNGGSNGGLLVGAVVNQRPDLFAAAVPQVGVMDMLRYHTFTIGWNWANDYGRSDDSKEMFEYLKAYSPLHNIKNDGTKYPAIMVTTADHDDRVVPAHSFKYAATLQASNTGDAPKLIRIDSKAGHGGGKPVSKIMDEYSDIYAFIMYNLGMQYK